MNDQFWNAYDLYRTFFTQHAGVTERPTSPAHSRFGRWCDWLWFDRRQW
ncbi:hypothetical protein [Levilactobacillus spicheri]